jgi:transcriptional regulator with XRE-family HTH domain
MNSVGERLREERLRLGHNQSDFAEIGGVQRRAQVNYEADERSPDAGYLAAIAAQGADIQYVVTGRRQGQGIGESAVHQAVLDAVELLSLEKKVDSTQLARAVVKLALKSAAISAVPVQPLRQEQVFHGDVGQAVKVEGNLDQRGIRFMSKRKNEK